MRLLRDNWPVGFGSFAFVGDTLLIVLALAQLGISVHHLLGLSQFRPLVPYLILMGVGVLAIWINLIRAVAANRNDPAAAHALRFTYVIATVGVLIAGMGFNAIYVLH